MNFRPKVGACLQAIISSRIACQQAPNPIPRIAALLFLALLSPALARATAPLHEVCVIVGAPGEPEFAQGFTRAARAWEKAAARAGANFTLIGIDDPPANNSTSDSSALAPNPHLNLDSNHDRDRFRAWLSSRAAASSDTPIWIVYLGHGTFDRREARLNLRGSDLTAKDLASSLAAVTRPLIFIHGGSAGTPFIPALSAPNRIIISATRSGHELNYARFGERFAEAVANPDADIDRDGQTSLLEAFVTASQQVQSFYAETGRLATEHALIDDNGDRQGTPAEWYRGLRLQRRVEGAAEPDGARAKLIALVPAADERALTAAQRDRRDALEHELETLRARKSELSEADYYRQLEQLFRQLGALYGRDT